MNVLEVLCRVIPEGQIPRVWFVGTLKNTTLRYLISQLKYLFIILPGPVGVGWYYYTTLCSQQQQCGNISGVRFRFRQEQVPEINDDDSNRPHNVARAAGA